MTYDLGRLRLNGLIRRLPRSNRYVLTEDGIRIAVFYTKIYNRLLAPPKIASRRRELPGPRPVLDWSGRPANWDKYRTAHRLR